MKAKIIIGSALRSLRKHKIRSLLTTLGIIIGVVSIICVTSIGEGAKHRVNKEIEKLGTNFIIAISSPQKQLTQQRGAFNRAIFTPADIKSIENEAENVAMISPGLIFSTKVVYGGNNWDTQIGGVYPNYIAIRKWKITKGEFFTDSDLRSRSKVAVIGQTVYKELFKGKNPIGKTIRIKRLPFKVIGLLEEQGKTPDGNDQDDTIILPITTLIRRIKGGKNKYFALVMAGKSKDKMQLAAQEVRSILRQMHRIPENKSDDFTIFTQDDMHQASDATSKVLNMLLIFVAAISLIVGGVGIMNIMLVTVTERTKEIGIRMALGATTSNILNQFMLEAVTICLFGGTIGVLLGIIASHIVGTALGWPIFIKISSVALSIGSSLFIGIFFGFYPAYRASQLNPVEALIDS